MSFMERLMNHNPMYAKKTTGYNSNIIVQLLNNYRSHEVILKVPNQIFYDGQLLVRRPAIDFCLKDRSFHEQLLITGQRSCR